MILREGCELLASASFNEVLGLVHRRELAVSGPSTLFWGLDYFPVLLYGRFSNALVPHLIS